MKRAVFFDRDGTLNQEIGYVSDPERIRLLPHAPEAVQAVREAGWLTIIVTNQGGVGRGLMTETQVQAVNRRVVELLGQHGVVMDGVYYCPHHPEGQIAEYRLVCECRKPSPGMLRQAAADHGIALVHSVVVGDKISDVQLAQAVGARGVLVRTGFGEAEWARAKAMGIQPDAVVSDVGEAVAWILGRDTQR